MAAPASKIHRGWYWDKENSTLDLYFGTGGASDPVEVMRVTGSAITKLLAETVDADLTISDDILLGIGSSKDARLSWDTTDANANALLVQLPAGGAVDVPVIAIGQSIESVDLGLYNGVVDPRIAMFGVGAVTTGPVVEFRKARGTIASPTVVTSGDDLGTLDFYGAVAAGEYVRAASIRADMTGTIATTRGPGNLSFNVATDAAPSVMTERLLITASGQINLTPATDVTMANGTGLVIGHTAQVTVGGILAELQVLGTADADSSEVIARWSADANGPKLVLAKSRNAAIGSFTVVQSGDILGTIEFDADDGADMATPGAAIIAAVDGSPSGDDMPTRLTFSTTTNGAATMTERMRLTNTGIMLIGSGAVTTHANMTGPGLVIDQATNDSLLLALKSSTDVATGLTTGTITQDVATDDVLVISKWAATTGGALVQVLGENAAVTTNFRLESYGGQAETTHTTAGRALIEFYAGQHDGANALAAVTADGNVFAIRANQGGSEVTVWLIDEDGAPQSIVDHAAFDHEDDVALLRSLDVARSDDSRGYIKGRWDTFVADNEQRLVEIGVLGAPVKDGGLMNLKKLAMLQNGAIHQMYSDMMDVAALLPKAAQAKLSARMQQRLLAAGV